MTPFARGIDVAGDNQPAHLMRYEQWAALGFCYGWYEVLRDGVEIPGWRDHRAAMRAAGYLTGAYFNLSHGSDGQMDKFLTLVLDGDELPDMLDCENGNLAGDDVRQACDVHDAHTARRLCVYTNKSSWERIVPPAARPYYRKYPLVAAGYPFDAPGPDQPMDLASVARRSTPPDWRLAPLMPEPWEIADVISWQHSGHGSLAGYAGFLDLHVSPLTIEQLRAQYGTGAQGLTPAEREQVAAIEAALRSALDQIGKLVA